MARYWVGWALLAIPVLAAACGTTKRYQTSGGEHFTKAVNSDPQGAQVRVDGQLMGVSPVVIEFRAPSYLVEYTTEGMGNPGVSATPGKDEHSRFVRKQRLLEISKEGFEAVQLIFTLETLESSIPSLIKLKGGPPPSSSSEGPSNKIDPVVSVTGSATSLSQLTVGGPDEFVCSLSHDQKWLLIRLRETEPGSSDGVLAKLEVGKNTRILLTPKGSDSADADWLPDGSAFVYVTNRSGNYRLCRSLGVTGEVGVRFITSEDLKGVHGPRVSPDGTTVAFSVRVPGQGSQLATIKMDGTDLKLLGEGEDPNWSPDGRKLVFSRQQGKGSGVYTMNSEDGADLTQLTLGTAADRRPFWSPDGKWVAFLSDRVKSRAHIFVVDAQGQKETQLTHGNFDVLNACWGRDAHVYLTANAGAKLDVWRLKPRLDPQK